MLHKKVLDFHFCNAIFMNSSHRCKILFLAAVSSGFESVCRLFLNGLSKNVTVGGRIGGRFYLVVFGCPTRRNETGTRR